MQSDPVYASTGVKRVSEWDRLEMLKAVNCRDIQGQSVQQRMAASNVLEVQGKAGQDKTRLWATATELADKCIQANAQRAGDRRSLKEA